MENRSSYTYSLKEIEEAKRIQKEYSKSESDYEKLKRIVKRAERNAQIPAISLGVIAAIIFGIGMCLCMVNSNYLWGIIIGVIGIAGCIASYFVYKSFLKREKEKIEDDVRELSEKIIGR